MHWLTTNFCTISVFWVYHIDSNIYLFITIHINIYVPIFYLNRFLLSKFSEKSKKISIAALTPDNVVNAYREKLENQCSHKYANKALAQAFLSEVGGPRSLGGTLTPQKSGPEGT